MDKKYSEINSTAIIQVQEKTKEIKNRLENTLYRIILTHKQMAMIISFIENLDGTERTEDEQSLLELLENSEVIE